MTDNPMSPRKPSRSPEIRDKSTRPHIRLKALDLRDEISFQKIVVQDFIELLLTATRQRDVEHIPAQGLFFAFKRYTQLVDELEQRFLESEEMWNDD